MQILWSVQQDSLVVEITLIIFYVWEESSKAKCMMEENQDSKNWSMWKVPCTYGFVILRGNDF